MTTPLDVDLLVTKVEPKEDLPILNEVQAKEIFDFLCLTLIVLSSKTKMKRL